MDPCPSTGRLAYMDFPPSYEEAVQGHRPTPTVPTDAVFDSHRHLVDAWGTPSSEAAVTIGASSLEVTSSDDTGTTHADGVDNELMEVVSRDVTRLFRCRSLQRCSLRTSGPSGDDLSWVITRLLMLAGILTVLMVVTGFIVGIVTRDPDNDRKIHLDLNGPDVNVLEWHHHTSSITNSAGQALTSIITTKRP